MTNQTPHQLYFGNNIIMKKFITFLLVLLLGIGANAQTQEVVFKKEGNTYSSSKKTTSIEKETGFTWKDSKGNNYTIFMSSTGSCYIKKISSKTGNEYKQYLGKEISADICKQLGVTYNPNR